MGYLQYVLYSVATGSIGQSHFPAMIFRGSTGTQLHSSAAVRSCFMSSNKPPPMQRDWLAARDTPASYRYRRILSPIHSRAGFHPRLKIPGWAGLSGASLEVETPEHHLGAEPLSDCVPGQFPLAGSERIAAVDIVQMIAKW